MSFFSPYDVMQQAVDIVHDSAHPTNKIASSIAGIDADGTHFVTAATNFWPRPLLDHFGEDGRIGNSSGTVHAETACILKAPRTQGASLFVTDPFCPNCAKNIAEAGIVAVYIDHKGFAKDFAARRADAFDDLSLQICQKAGIDVYRIHRKEQKLDIIWQKPDSYQPEQEQPVIPCAVAQTSPSAYETVLADAVENFARYAGRHPFAVALATDRAGALFTLAARAHPAIGYGGGPKRLLPAQPGKYSLMLEPVNRLLMNAPRFGLRIVDDYLYASKVPTAREFVNLIGAGLNGLRIENPSAARDQSAFMAMEQLTQAGILRVRS